MAAFVDYNSFFTDEAKTKIDVGLQNAGRPSFLGVLGTSETGGLKTPAAPDVAAADSSAPLEPPPSLSLYTLAVIIQIILTFAALIALSVCYGLATTILGILTAVPLLRLAQAIQPSAVANLPPLYITHGDAWPYLVFGVIGAAVHGAGLALYFVLSVAAKRAFRAVARWYIGRRATPVLRAEPSSRKTKFQTIIYVAHKLFIIACESVLIPVGSFVIAVYTGGEDQMADKFWFAVLINMLGIAWRWAYTLGWLSGSSSTSTRAVDEEVNDLKKGDLIA